VLPVKFVSRVKATGYVLLLSKLLVASVAALAGAGDFEPALPIANPYEGDPTRAVEGKSLFNQYCSHCHAPNAVSPDPPKDLRRLKTRYGERMAEVFHFTVTHGRPDKGMPNWKGLLEEQTLWTIFTFLQSVQAQP
jgi:polar amino acid transport system substrate-binding protein